MSQRPSLYPLTPEMATLVGRIDLSAMYPPFADLYVECLQACLGRGAAYYAISGARSWEEQTALFANGRRRQPNGSWVIVDASKVVTNAGPGSSLHNFGAAADSCRDKDVTRAGLQAGWSRADYEVLAEEATKLGLDAGLRWASFPDAPHLQLDLRSRGLSVSHLRSLFERGGMPAVFGTLDQFSWRKQ